MEIPLQGLNLVGIWLSVNSESLYAVRLFGPHSVDGVQGTNFGITRMLRRGTPVEVLDVDKKSSWDTF